MVLKVCVHEWLSGGVSPCQGEGRGFESRCLHDRESLENIGFSVVFKAFCVFKISSGTKYSVIGTHVSVQGSHERSHGLSVSMNLPHIFSKRTFEKIQKNKKNSSILNYPML